MPEYKVIAHRRVHKFISNLKDQNGYVKIQNASNMSLVKSMHGRSVLLTDEDRALLLKVSGLLEEIIETLEILADEDTVKSIREAEEDVKAGRVRDYNEFLKELKQSGEI